MVHFEGSRALFQVTDPSTVMTQVGTPDFPIPEIWQESGNLEAGHPAPCVSAAYPLYRGAIRGCLAEAIVKSCSIQPLAFDATG